MLGRLNAPKHHGDVEMDGDWSSAGSKFVSETSIAISALKSAVSELIVKYQPTAVTRAPFSAIGMLESHAPPEPTTNKRKLNSA